MEISSLREQEETLVQYVHGTAEDAILCCLAMIASSYISIAGNNRSCAQFVFFAAPLRAGCTVTEKKQLVLRSFNCDSWGEIRDSRMQHQMLAVEMQNHLLQAVPARRRILLLSALWHPWL